MADSAQIILALIGGLGGLYTLGQKLGSAANIVPAYPHELPEVA